MQYIAEINITTVFPEMQYITENFFYFINEKIIPVELAFSLHNRHLYRFILLKTSFDYDLLEIFSLQE
jgi:hypothetical protein